MIPHITSIQKPAWESQARGRFSKKAIVLSARLLGENWHLGKI